MLSLINESAINKVVEDPSVLRRVKWVALLKAECMDVVATRIHDR